MGLEHLEIGIRFEEVFHLDMEGDFWEVVFAEIPPHVLVDSRSPAGTVGRVYEELLKRLAVAKEHGPKSSPWTKDNVWTTTRSILAESLGVPLEQVTSSARLIQDLGMG